MNHHPRFDRPRPRGRAGFATSTLAGGPPGSGAPKAGQEKCYGVAKAGQNDCGTASHSCAAQGAKVTTTRPNGSTSPKGTCEQMGGKATAAEGLIAASSFPAGRVALPGSAVRCPAPSAFRPLPASACGRRTCGRCRPSGRRWRGSRCTARITSRAGGAALAALDRIRTDYPVSLHGVGSSLGSTDPLSGTHLAKLSR